MNFNYILIILVFFYSCDSGKDNSIKSNNFPKPTNNYQNSDSNQPETNSSIVTKTTIKDSFRTFEVDDYPITLEMLRKLDRTNGILKYKSGKTITYDIAWFTDSRQTIVIRLATDYYRFYTYHFHNEDIPEEVMYEIGFNAENGDLASHSQIMIDFPGFLKQSDKIDSKFFLSNKGIKLGVNRQKAISIYGNPDTTIILKGIQKIEWSFHGDEELLIEDIQKPIARNSFGHKITLYFRKDKLIAQSIFNDIP